MNKRNQLFFGFGLIFLQSCDFGKNSQEELLLLEERAVRAIEMSDRKSALLHLDTIVGIDRSYPMALRLMGESLIAIEKYDEAVSVLKESILKNSGDLQDYIWLATALERSGNNEEALDSLREGIDSLQDVPDVKNGLRYSPNEERLFLYTLNILNESEQMNLALMFAERGFKRNSGSSELFKAWVDLLRLTGEREVEKSVKDEHCGRKVIRNSPVCKQT